MSANASVHSMPEVLELLEKAKGFHKISKQFTTWMWD